jgi:hypothetical protein
MDPDDMFTTWDAWQRFALPLAFDISGRPVRLRRKGGAAQTARERISKSGLHPEQHPHTLKLVRVEQGVRR